MPGKNHRFTPKEDRMADHVKDSEMKSGKSAEEAERIGYATMQKNKSARRMSTAGRAQQIRANLKR